MHEFESHGKITLVNEPQGQTNYRLLLEFDIKDQITLVNEPQGQNTDYYLNLTFRTKSHLLMSLKDYYSNLTFGTKSHLLMILKVKSEIITRI